MIYKELNEIPLNKFIKVFCGDYKFLLIDGSHNKKELKETAKKLTREYISIVSSRSVIAEIDKKNEIMVCAGKIELMNACQLLISSEKWDEVVNILSELGYVINVNNKIGIKTRINSIISNSNYRLKQLENSLNSPVKESNIMDEDYFVREKSIIMTHYKMAFSSKDITAKEYAYMVKAMFDEIERTKPFFNK